jgi:transposase
MKTHSKCKRKEPVMKKNSIPAPAGKKVRHRKRSPKNQSVNRRYSGAVPEHTMGLDLGDKTSRYFGLDKDGNETKEAGVATTKKALATVFGKMRRSRIALEVGTHSPWVSRLLESLGHEVIVANARRVRAISDSNRKNDKMDARILARLARVDPELLYPIRHRGERAQQHLAMIRSRAALVDGRTALINTARGQAKSFGERLEGCDADQMREEKLEKLPEGMRAALGPVLGIVEQMTKTIHEYDKQLAEIGRKEYPETALLEQISGVGLLIALTYILTLDDPGRFGRSRDVGPYLGLTRKQKDSGESQPELRITKEGDVYLRRLLVQGAHHILSTRGPDTDLKRWGLALAGNGSKKAKNRAVIGVARKLAVLLHHLWVSGEVYEPLRQSQTAEKAGTQTA